MDLEVQTSHASVESAPQLRLRVISWNFARRVGWIGLGGGSWPSRASAIFARGFGGEVGGLRIRVQPEEVVTCLALVQILEEDARIYELWDEMLGRVAASE